MDTTKYNLKSGKISSFVKLDDSVIRFVSQPKIVEEDEELLGFVAQGHITSCSEHQLNDLSIDISYFDKSGQFLGLSKSSFFDADELTPGETIPFEVDLDLPEETKNCILNISAKERKGLWARLWYGKNK